MATGTDHHDEERRRAVRQALGALTGILPLGLVAVDPEGRVWYQSQRWQGYCGMPDADLYGRLWYEAAHPDDRCTLAARWATRVETQGRLGELRAVGEDGVVRRCRAEAVAMVGADHGLDGYLVLFSDGDPSARELTSPTLSTPNLLRMVLERSPDIITILNRDGSWRWSSGGAIRLFGHLEGFDAATGMFSVMHPDDRETATQALVRAMAREVGPEERFELRLRAADGSWRTMEALLDELLDEPAVQGLVVHLRDVTERRRTLDALEANELHLGNLIRSMRTAVVLEDENRTIVLANQAFADLFRLTPAEELTGRTLDTLDRYSARVVDPPDADQVVRKIRAARRRVGGMRFVLYDGRTLECDFSPVNVHGVDRGYMSTYRDVTSQARAEAERERLLASEREENRRLAELDAYRSESIAAVSHELRTPLTSIVGYTQLLRSMLDPVASPEEVAALDAIVRNVDRLLRLAGDVVALDSLESRAMPLPVSPVEMGEVLRRAVSTVGPEATAKGIDVALTAGEGPPVRGDQDRLGQLFDNLLSNAVKFTPEDGQVRVRSYPRDGGWQVTVSDSGIGIPSDELALLFTRFFRASNARTRGFPGAGLGLSVARAIAERHGGWIEVDSRVGAGTTVTVHIADALEEIETDVPHPGPVIR